MHTETGSGAPDRFDLTMLHAVHDAFRRDAARLTEVAEGGAASSAVRRGWDVHKRHLTVQHAAETAMLWTVLRVRLAGRPGRLAALEDMDRRHLTLVARLDAVDAALAHGDGPRLAEQAREYSAAQNALLDHKEAEVLPLLRAELSEYEWGAYEIESRRRLGAKGLASFLPWVLDGAPEARRAAVLDLLPTPVRVLCLVAWMPRYSRRPHWAA